MKHLITADILKGWLSIPTNSMVSTLVEKINLLERFYGRNIYTRTVAKDGKDWAFFKVNSERENRPLLISHVDTVTTDYSTAPFPHEIEITKTVDILGQTSNKLSLAADARPVLKCLGGDDRPGIATIVSAIQALMEEEAPTESFPDLLFPSREEIGLLGTKAFVEQFPNLTPTFILEFDRKAQDVVFYGCESEPFQKAIGTIFNRNKGSGSSSDIRVFQNKHNTNSCNIGVGFYNPHRRTEYIKVEETNNTANQLFNLFKNHQSAVSWLEALEWEEPVVRYSYKYDNPKTYSTTSSAPKKDTPKPATTPKPGSTPYKMNAVNSAIKKYKNVENWKELLNASDKLAEFLNSEIGIGQFTRWCNISKAFIKPEDPISDLLSMFAYSIRQKGWTFKNKNKTIIEELVRCSDNLLDALIALVTSPEPKK